MGEIKKQYILINNLGGGGAERQVSSLANLKEIEKVISLEPIVHYPINRDKLSILFSHQARNLFDKAWQLIATPAKMKKVGVNKDANLLCFLQLSYIAGYICKRIIGCEYTICIRTNPLAYYQHVSGIKLPMFLFKHLLRQADHVIANSKSTAYQLEQHFGLNHVHTITNGYDVEKLHKMSQTLPDEFVPLYEKHKVLVHTGRLAYDKGQWHLLRVFAEVVKQDPTVRLLLLGRGPYLPKLQQLCIDLGLSFSNVDESQNEIDTQHQVLFCGFRSNPYAFYPKAKLFLFPSIYEGLPNAPLEALICGVPCFLSDCISGPREILFPDDIHAPVAHEARTSKYGVLFPPFDGKENFSANSLQPLEKMWSQEILRFLYQEDCLLALQQNTPEIAEQYSDEVSAKQWIRFCENRH
jgi:glycosyltransferase involved in cell wall biosynthesis